MKKGGGGGGHHALSIVSAPEIAATVRRGRDMTSLKLTAVPVSFIEDRHPPLKMIYEVTFDGCQRFLRW
jgi:hypothetical protein